VPPGQTPQNGVVYRVQSVPVSITGGPTTLANPLQPDAYGCVFAEVQPGTYSVTLNDPSTSGYGTPPFVANLLTSNSQPTSPTTSTAVSIGQTSLVQYQYDEATQPISVIYTLGIGGTTISTPTNGIPLTVSNSGLKPSTFWTIVPKTSGPAVTALPGPGLYPFADGYTIFAGDCGAESTTSGVSSFATDPGKSTSVITVPLALVTIDMTTALGPDLLGFSVNLVTAVPPPTNCPTDTYPLLSLGGGSYDAAVPFGNYSLSVSLAGVPVVVPIVGIPVTNPTDSVTELLPS
jgi:hypothetical protein